MISKEHITKGTYKDMFPDSEIDRPIVIINIGKIVGVGDAVMWMFEEEFNEWMKFSKEYDDKIKKQIK